jgi:hypothetical protein
MVLLLAPVIGIETADTLVREILPKNLRDEPFDGPRNHGADMLGLRVRPPRAVPGDARNG